MHLQVLIAFCGITMKRTKCTNVSYFEITACYDSTPLDVIHNKPRVVDVIPGSVVHLWCNFCEAKADYFPKLWFYKPRGNKTPKEILTGIETNDTKLSITPNHELSIHDFHINNSGIYICKAPEFLIERSFFLYVLEGVFNIEMAPKVGTLSHWQDYKRNHLDAVTKKLENSVNSPLKSLRKSYQIVFKLITVWDNWSECKDIDHQKGIRKRIGRCRLQTSPANNTPETSTDTLPKKIVTPYFADGYDIPCRSLLLNKTVPEISKIVRIIPDFEMEETCYVLKRATKHKTNKEKTKHKTTKKVAENSHLTLLCSEVIPSSNLMWYKNKKLLNSSLRNNIICRNEEEPHISVDTNNSLHILHISKNEEGNYSCLVNGKTVQEFEVQVVSKSKLLNQEFIRYSIYLGFVLSLTMTCYCAGVCVAWHRRSSFADPLNVNKKRIHNLPREREKLLK